MGGPVSLAISDHVIFTSAPVPPVSRYNNLYSIIGNFLLFSVLYFHRTLMSLDVTSASTFSGGYGSKKTIAIKTKKEFFPSCCPRIKRNSSLKITRDSSVAKNPRSVKEVVTRGIL